MVQILFEYPLNLWYLLLLPLLTLAHFYFLRHIQRKALLFANFRALKRITGKHLITRNYTLLGVRLLVFALIILAISGATLWYEGLSNNNDFVIAIDTSASMSAQDILPTRLDAAKSNANLFIDALDSETRIGIISFAGVSLIQSPLIKDREELKRIIGDVELLRAGGTDIPGAIITSTNLLLDNTRGRAILMITDGSNTIEAFSDSSMARALAYSNEYRVTIHTIGIGSVGGPIGYLPTFYNVSATYNEENLFQIANLSSGTYTQAENQNELLAAFQIISDESSQQLLRRDLRPGLLLSALLLLFFEWLILSTRFRSLP